jgi:hypothetical protein
MLIAVLAPGSLVRTYGRKKYMGGFRERYMRLPDILDVLLIYGRN